LNEPATSLAQRQARHASPTTTVTYDLCGQSALDRVLAKANTGYVTPNG
jgi:hypothetical protein